MIETVGCGAKKALTAANPTGADAAAWMGGRLICASTLVDRLVHAHSVDDMDAAVARFLDAWAPIVSWLHAASVLALLEPPPPFSTRRASPLATITMRAVDCKIARHVLDRVCARICADDSTSAHIAVPSWRRTFDRGVLAAVAADYSETAMAFLFRTSTVLACDPTLTLDSTESLVEYIASQSWDHIAGHDAACTAQALLGLIKPAPFHNTGDAHDLWRWMVCVIGWTYRKGAWTNVVARTSRFKVYDLCAPRQDFSINAKAAAHYANVDLLRRLPDHLYQGTKIIADVLDGPSSRGAAAAALDWLAAERAFVPTHIQADHLFGTQPWLSGGRRRLSLLLDRWPHLVDVARQCTHQTVASVLGALGANDLAEAEHMMEVLSPHAPDLDEGLWPTLVDRLHHRGYCQVVDLHIACALAVQRDHSPLWQAWCGDMTKPIDKRRVLACTTRIGPGALDARAKEELDGLFACLASHGLLIECASFACDDDASHGYARALE